MEGRTVASMRTEEDDLSSGPASQRQDCGSVTHPRRRASGVKGLSKMTTRSRKLGKVPLARLVRYRVGTLRFNLPEKLGNERSCETTREILAKAKADPEQGIAGVQKAPSILRITTDVTRKSGDLKEEARDLHLQIAEMRSELNKKRVEKSLINDEVASRLIHEIGHRLRLRKRNS